MADVLESNRNEIEKFLAQNISLTEKSDWENGEAWFSESSAFDWSHYFAFVSTLERGMDETADQSYEVRNSIERTAHHPKVGAAATFAVLNFNQRKESFHLFLQFNFSG